MANWFDDLTKTLADASLTRRQALKHIAGTATAVVLAFWLPEQALAANQPNHHCTLGGGCMGSFLYCGHNKYENCYCMNQMGRNYGVCVCNTYCASAPPCSHSSQCGIGYACVTNNGCGCTIGFCMQKCTKTCQLDSQRAGRTAASVI